jgi:23S rRNA (adenine2030-N6)-methyltransferase
MNYRHAFHAGNHADVLKHAVLARVLWHLRKKEKPFCVLDAHAGRGGYDLQALEAQKTAEWQSGIGLLDKGFAGEVEAILEPYRAAVSALNPDGGLRYYPGSPALVQQGLRAGDRLIANELHPVDFAALAENFAGDRRVRVTAVDALLAVKAELPFPQRRGLVLLDPPFEVKDETARTMQAVAEGVRRFATGIFMIWYPVKGVQFAEDFLDTAQALGIANMLASELRVKEAFDAGGLAGSGLVIINPPYGLHDELQILLPALAERLGVGQWGRGTVNWLTPPK